MPQYAKILAFLAFISTFLLTACSENFIYEETKSIPNGAWAYADTLDYTLNITDTTQLYNLYLDIDHTVDYPFQNIYLKIHTQYPSGKRISEQLPIDFADKTGQWYGKCSGEDCHLRVNIQQRAFFNEVGKHVITLEQFLRKNPLQGMKNIALKMEHVAPQ